MPSQPMPCLECCQHCHWSTALVSHTKVTWFLSYLECCYCYKHLEPPTFFPTSIIFTIPHSMEYDHERWRDLCRDLGPVHRWWCSVTDIWDPPLFFFSPALSTVPLFVGHDNQWQRDLLRDLRPVCRQWCSKHCLLTRLSSLPPSCSISFHFRLIYTFISKIMPCIVSHHHAYAFASAWLPHLSHFVIMFTIMHHSCLPS